MENTDSTPPPKKKPTAGLTKRISKSSPKRINLIGQFTRIHPPTYSPFSKFSSLSKSVSLKYVSFYINNVKTYIYQGGDTL